jgi:type I restriction enzyme S subunit
MTHSYDWRRVTLGDCVTTKKGFAFKSSWYTEAGHAIVKVSDFTVDSVCCDSLTRISLEIASKYLPYAIATGDLVVQTVGSWPNNPQSVVGKAIRVPAAANRALLNQNAVRLDPIEIANRRFLFYLLRNKHFKSYIVNTAQGAASQAAITLDSLREYEFCFHLSQPSARLPGCYRRMTT